jgi:hypothetical protein
VIVGGAPDGAFTIPGLMARALFAVGTALVLLLLGLGLAVYLTRDEDNIQVSNVLAEDFSREVAQAEQRGANVDLRTLTPDDWDELLIVARGTPRAAISERLGREWTGVASVATGELLILLRGGEVVRFFDYRGEGRFTGVETPIAELARDDAVFRVRRLEISPKE